MDQFSTDNKQYGILIFYFVRFDTDSIRLLSVQYIQSSHRLFVVVDRYFDRREGLVVKVVTPQERY